MKKLMLILVFFSFCHIGFVQGLLSYVKWEADSQGPEKFDRIAIDLSWNQWQKVPNNLNQGYFSFGFSSSWFKDLPLGQKSNCAIALGLGFESMSFHHNGILKTVQDNMPVEVSDDEKTVIPKRKKNTSRNVLFISIPQISIVSSD